jgi:leucyl aminopeptidase
MQIRIVSDQPWSVEADVLAVPLTLDEPAALDAEILAELDRRLGGGLAAYREFGELEAKAHKAGMLRASGMGAGWLLGVGAGSAAEFDRLAAVRLGATVIRRLAGRPVRRLAIWLPEALTRPQDPGPQSLALLVARGVEEGGYEPRALYNADFEAAPPVLDELIIIATGSESGMFLAAAERGRVIGEGARIARDLANRASNEVSPEVLADEAGDLAREHGLEIDVIGPDRAAELGMGLFLAVGRGSDNPPRMVVLRNGPPDARDAKDRLLALVGKGVTFDSGGISLKPADRMEEMKMDKTGAATVIAAAVTLRRLAPELPFLIVAPCVENMPGPHSARPGDVVRALNGKAVEIQNTDAEGRLILGDALTYAERLGATHLVDLATLTGAVERAFGKLVTGGFGTPQWWWEAVAAAGARQGERHWQIPLVDDYVPDLESWYADFLNTGGAEGSLVKSGLFLREFVTRPWVHLDIAGTAYLRKATPWAARGATGSAHATIVELALEGSPSGPGA